MTYEEAVQFMESKHIQPNQVDSNGFSYDDIIIVPTNPDSQKSFFQAFLRSQNAKESIAPYIHEDVAVWAIDTKHLNDAGVLFYDNLQR